jgi:hypothetical protein
MIIPDTQCKPGAPIDHLSWVGEHIAYRKPDVIVHLGDHWDMPSLSSYDKKGGRKMENARYVDDVAIGNEAMALLLGPIEEAMRKDPKWKPRFVFTLGNHEERIIRAVEDNPHQLEGVIGYHNLDLDGWEVHPYLSPAIIDGVAYCHFFTSGVMGRPVTSARALLQKKHMSCVMGHVQDTDIAIDMRADGKRVTGLFAGICYQHDEDYLNPQTNNSWRGMWELNEVCDGHFDFLPVSMNYLKETYS